jgi:hypothetical protein
MCYCMFVLGRKVKFMCGEILNFTAGHMPRSKSRHIQRVDCSRRTRYLCMPFYENLYPWRTQHSCIETVHGLISALTTSTAQTPRFRCRLHCYLRVCPRARFTVALPLARPTPLPRTARDRNIGAFLSMSGTMKRRTCDPRM